MSVTDKYQKTIDLSKLGTNPYRRDGGLSTKAKNIKQQYQEYQPLRSESTKSKRGVSNSQSSHNNANHHNRGQSMINGSATTSSNNNQYYRPVCSTKNAVGPMISSRTQNNSYKSSQQHLNYISMNPKKGPSNNGA